MLTRILQSDAFYSFSRQPLVVAAAFITAAFMLSALLAPWIAPHNPFDLSTVTLLDAKTPPVWHPDGTWTYMLGTDHQGRDILSAIIY
jgi:peptide/nickel transport system permease protein